jgi:RES domain-containing protein
VSAPRAGPLPGPPPEGVKELGNGPSFLESAPRAGPLPGPPPEGVKELGNGPSFLESDAVRLWRIAADTPDYEADDLGGKGAEGSGGRWNRVGTPLIYASTSRALACLETLVRPARNPLPLNRYLVEVTVPAAAWSAAIEFDPAALVGWDAEPAGKVSLDWGTAWAAGATTLLARVPSLIVPEEANVLINPAHRAIGQVRARKLRKWLYDRRLV